MKKKVIVFTGGGTAGHVIPNLSIIETLRDKAEVDFHYIGLQNSQEEKLVSEYPDIIFHPIYSAKFNRSLRYMNIFELRWILKGIQEAKKALIHIQPDLIFSKGGYVAFPVIFAGSQCKIPMIAHESDITPGLANRLSSRYVNKILTTFEETLTYYPNKGEMVGTPIRPSLLKGDPQEGRRITKLSAEKPILLVMGGSQGSQFINQTIRNLLPKLLENFSILHICGIGNLDNQLTNIADYYQIEFALSELPHFYACSSYAISRAGANSIMELVSLQIPNILIPLTKKYSRGDQIANAKSFEKHGLSIILEEHKVIGNVLINHLDCLQGKAFVFKENMKRYLPINSSDKICEIILNSCK